MLNDLIKIIYSGNEDDVKDFVRLFKRYGIRWYQKQQVLNALKKPLQHQQPDVAKRALLAIGQIFSRSDYVEALKLLNEVILSTKNNVIRNEAIKAFCKIIEHIDDIDIVDSLISFLSIGSKDIRSTVMSTLRRIVEISKNAHVKNKILQVAKEELMIPHSRTVADAAGILGSVLKEKRDRNALLLLLSVLDRFRSVNIVGTIIDSISLIFEGSNDVRVLKILSRYAEDPRSDIREALCIALKRIFRGTNNPEVLPILRKIFNDSNAQVKELAVETLLDIYVSPLKDVCDLVRLWIQYDEIAHAKERLKQSIMQDDDISEIDILTIYYQILKRLTEYITSKC